MRVLLNGVTDIHRLPPLDLLEKILLAESDTRHGGFSCLVLELQLDVTEPLPYQLAIPRIEDAA